MTVTTTERPAFKTGDSVVIAPDFAPAHLLGKVWTVTQVKPKNVICKPLDGAGRGIDYPADMLRPFRGEVREDGSVVVPFEDMSPTAYHLGEIVTLRTPSPKRAETDATPYVVVKDDGRDRVNVARLGGDGSRYLRVPRGGLVKRDAAWLREVLPA